jgi:hypothetical protein
MLTNLRPMLLCTIRLCLVISSCSAGLYTVAPAQTAPPSGTVARPTFGGTSPRSSTPPRIITGSQNTEILRHRDFAGKPCLSIGGFARPHTSNSNLFDHVIEIKNGCAQSIRTQICYLRTQDCITMEVAGRMTKQANLGTLPSIRDFQYEFRERF